jgi:hypothetical protein
LVKSREQTSPWYRPGDATPFERLGRGRREGFDSQTAFGWTHFVLSLVTG